MLKHRKKLRKGSSAQCAGRQNWEFTSDELAVSDGKYDYSYDWLIANDREEDF